MQNPYYEITIPVFIKMLQNLSHLLTQGQKFALENGVSEETMLANRLAPDMFPLARQVQIATDNAKGAVARLCGIEAPVMEDTESTVAELHERIAKTIAFLESITKEQFDGAHEREVHVKYFPNMHFVGYDYLTQYALPNFLFHVSIAYALLRAMGADIGKKDYLGPLNLQPNN
ncbi:MAG: hypothetical protein RLZZ76_237 [Candidatus Parcubacteria bacterium]|jgi:hypothetical protein